MPNAFSTLNFGSGIAAGPHWKSRLFWVRATTICVAYLCFGKLLLLPLWDGVAIGRIVWPASGIALAGLLLGGRSLWPAITLGAGLTTYVTGGDLPLIVSTAIGNTLEAWAVVYLLDRSGFLNRLDRVRWVLLLIAGAIAGAVISAIFGVIGIFAGGSAPSAELGRILWLWTSGHSMGTLIVAPFLLTIRSGLRQIHDDGRLVEAAAIFAGLTAVGLAAFRLDSTAPLEYLPFPLLIWAAFRLGPPGAAAANFVLCGLALWWTALGWGPFSRGAPDSNYFFTWFYANVTAVTTMLLSAVIAHGKQAERERKARENEYRLLIEQAPDGVLIFGASGACLDVNTSACDMLRYPVGGLLGVSIEPLIASAERRRAGLDLDALEPGSAALFSWTMIRRDGSEFPAEVSAKRFSDGRLQAFVRNVTDRKSLELQLMRSQKMEAVGMLAGGVAHEFNNLLTIILGHSEVARASLPAHSRTSADIGSVIEASERAAKLTRSLLTFARRQPTEPRTIPLNDLAADMTTMLRRVLGEDINFSAVLSPDPWSTRIDPGLLQQVVVNIGINARDAMPKGGRLILECRNQVLDAEEASAAGLEPGDYATLRITDTGVGMDLNTVARIFEPFFTTKDRAEGTGLGLAVSYGIVEQAGGAISVVSELGKGSTFTVHLPRAATDASGARSDTLLPAEAPEPPRRTETILLIEDEAGVRELALSILETWSYRVLVADDGEQAVALARKASGPIDMVLSDVVLPGISGPDAVRKIRAAIPGIKVLYISGYAEDRLAKSELSIVGTGFLAKPFKPAELLTAVGAMLQDSESPTAPHHSADAQQSSS